MGLESCLYPKKTWKTKDINQTPSGMYCKVIDKGIFRVKDS